MRVVWQRDDFNEGLSLLDVAYYVTNPDAENLQVHLRKGTVVNIPLDQEAARIVILWFHNQYQIEKEKLLADLERRSGYEYENLGSVELIAASENRGSHEGDPA